MEIPYSHTIPAVREWINFLVGKTCIGKVFSLTGDNEGVSACHSALITIILIRTQYDKEDLITKESDWILKYQ